MILAATDSGSFRDPAGRVYLAHGRVFRTVMPGFVEEFDFVRSTGLIDELIGKDWLIAETLLDLDEFEIAGDPPAQLLEHPRLPFISYPYEWPFALLKAAALHQLEVHLRALDFGVTLADASAYNIQFHGTRPIFIDSLSFRRYREGEFWLAHRQFCEQFLNPLLLRSLRGIPHHAWYRGELEGISAQTLTQVLPLRQKLGLNVLMHVVLPARFQRRAGNQASAEQVITRRTLPLAAFKRMLQGMRRWIARLEPADGGKSAWRDYAGDNSYAADEALGKRRFISEFSAQVVPGILWDIGCNTGDYAKVALDAGAGTVVGFDFDQGALDRACARASSGHLPLLPLFMDAANPPPEQGWAQQERSGLLQRGPADALLALALVHHLAIGKNIPLADVIDWLTRLAPTGIIEFVPKTDPMVRTLLSLREDIFEHYGESQFVRALEARAEIVRSQTTSASGRKLFWYRCH